MDYSIKRFHDAHGFQYISAAGCSDHNQFTTLTEKEVKKALFVIAVALIQSVLNLANPYQNVLNFSLPRLSRHHFHGKCSYSGCQ